MTLHLARRLLALGALALAGVSAAGGNTGGQRYLLELSGELPERIEHLNAWLIEEGSTAILARLRVHGGDEPWVSSKVPLSSSDGLKPLQLALGDDRGTLFGAAPLPLRAGSAVAIELRATGSLEVEFELEAPPLPADGASAELDGALPWDAEGFLLPQVEIRALDAAVATPLSAWRLARRRYLAAGEYEVRVWSRTHEVAKARAEVRAGRTTALRLEPELVRETIDVRGSVRTELGAELPLITVVLQQGGDAPRRWTVAYDPSGGCGFGIDAFLTRGEDERGHFGRFALERLPAGPLEVTAYPLDVPAEVRVVESAKGELELEVLLLDADDRPGYGFDVRERGGLVEPRYRVHTRPLDGGQPLFAHAANGRAIARGDPLARRLEWCVAWRGMRPIYGSERDFGEAGDGLSLARVRLEPGWGTCILARDADGDPLAGVGVELDGELAGRTDARGRLELARDEEPERMTFECGAWELVEGDGVPGSAGTRAGAWHELVFARSR